MGNVSSMGFGKKIIRINKGEQMKYSQQGDVLVKQISNIPSSAKKLNHLTLALGEKTGHHHTITEGDAELYEVDGVLYLKVNSEQATLTHQEHKPILIEEGIYQIGIVKEYDHFLEEARNVAD